MLARIDDAGIAARLLGGLAVAEHHHGPVPSSLQRTYRDIDIVVRRADAQRFTSVLEGLGYTPNSRFNSLNGDRRMIFVDPRHDRQVDVFVGTFQMCHVLDLDHRLVHHKRTLSPADLLLTKLQIVQINEKDVVDGLTLILHHEVGQEQGGDVIGLDRLTEVTSRDWGWFTTIHDNLLHLRGVAKDFLEPADAKVIRSRIMVIAEELEQAPKSGRWRLRARVGRRMSWYDLPEEVG